MISLGKKPLIIIVGLALIVAVYFFTKQPKLVDVEIVTLEQGEVRATVSNSPARFLSVPEEYGSPEDWALVDLDFGSGIGAALTIPAKCYGRIELKQLGLPFKDGQTLRYPHKLFFLQFFKIAD